MIEAMLKAAARGVRVVVLVPGKIDHEINYRASRSNYGCMLLGNIQIFEHMVALMLPGRWWWTTSGQVSAAPTSTIGRRPQ